MALKLDSSAKMWTAPTKLPRCWVGSISAAIVAAVTAVGDVFVVDVYWRTFMQLKRKE